MHPQHPVIPICSTLLLTAIGCCSFGNNATALKYDLSITRTSYGVPHIEASTIGGAAYGVAYAYAQDNLCLLADQLLTVRGERSKYLGPDLPIQPGSTITNLDNDFFFHHVLDEASLTAIYANLSDPAQQMLDGYVAGYNRFLRDRTSAVATSCDNAAWVKPMSRLDMYRLMSDKAILSGLSNYVTAIAQAAPPTAAPLSKAKMALSPAATANLFDRALNSGPQLGSNAYGLGSDATENGSGLLLGNPHFPWSTTNRFYQMHLTVPGQFDVMGASLGGFPLVNIGFNKDIAWSHTVSTGRRFTLFELTLQNGTNYVFDGVVKPLLQKTVSVEVLRPDGSLETRTRQLYASHHGPILVAPGLGWTNTKAFAIKDVNLENSRLIEQWLRMSQAKSVDDIKQALLGINGLPWVNTIAADRNGKALYADISATPYVTKTKLASCATSPLAQAFLSKRLFVLDGSTRNCEWDVDPNTNRPNYPAGQMPAMIRNDYVANSNESAWLANPNQLNDNLPLIIGDSTKEQSHRTRMAFTQITDRLTGNDGKVGNRFNLGNLEEVFFDARSYSAELLTDSLVNLCRANPISTATSGNSVNLTEACNTLAAWSKRMNFDAVGVPVFREFWRSARNLPNLWTTPFAPADPIRTPRGLNSTDATVSTALLRMLADSVEKLAANNIALSAPLRSIQYVGAASLKLPLDGGDEFEGTFNKMTPAAGLTPVGYTPIVYGSSYIQAVTFDGNGPVARGILTYSQSTNPASPYYSDQTAVYSSGRWVTLPFKAADIAAATIGSKISLRE
ncbi:penicillin acylase family protein [Chitinimonas sp. BJB300]|uniref:penicillin acylase family protein n=1 Tax=Chitinimonas sp. BJB300 TaxID=1559339 RepID=UPI000C0D80CA|nr:penicillin acylase family protein [Chitinimonas sp. BJB300]PHV13253.1 acylase [Chitinimonas sp. BJB300]TSJ89645.1 acylase [Chitinimonas sp. BJB300]